MSALPPLPTAPLDEPLRVVVLTCGPHGRESAAALVGLEGVEVVGVLRAPLPRPRTFVRRLKVFYRRHGPAGLARLPFRRLAGLLARGADDGAPDGPGAVPVVEIDSFVSAAGLDALRAMRPHLGVVDGTNVLKPATFAIPTFGSVNLHCGKLPEYRGAPPGFWELYNGERQVGVTIHRVTQELDGGPILAQSILPLEPAPREEPMAYLRALLERRLRPLGISLLREVVASVAAGRAVERPQPPGPHETYRFPDFRTVRELRRRVRAR
ncbi:formyltransferase family protein [Roseisolibacter sp. H3M3-2]|uniref:formyltransferase family protein n=1 Tax=Roseisolibacter sp. H3M3-2 TaxID=3031323 RepID=UPI0023DCA576|nr:formyltransferase family protein [Roseisolibacter sp. H3M3-2]MDF1505730.1 formyltransferase family protein [Roseisolibacter sp. H3M3-2]